MPCIKLPIYKGFVGLMCLTLLISCASNPSQKSSSAKKKQAQETVSQTSGIAIGSITPLPNPYLAKTPSAPGPVQKGFPAVQSAMQAKQWSQAEGPLKQWVAQYPKMSGLQVNLALVYWKQNKIDLAEQTFKSALAANPTNGDAYVQYGVMLREQGRFNDAEQQYKKALAVWPHNPDALRNLGVLLDLYRGRFDEALNYYELLLKLSTAPNKEVEGWVIDLKRRQNK